MKGIIILKISMIIVKKTSNSKLIKQDWLNFFNRHSDINLHLYTLADFELNIPLLTKN